MADKETKVLVEGFRMFLKNKLSEAPKSKENPDQMGLDFSEKPAKKATKTGSPSVVKVFDFGGTLFQPSHALLKNPFFYLSLSPEGMELFDSKLQDGGLNSAKANMDKVDSYSYVVSRVSSFGPGKDKAYFKSLLAKGDQKLKAFMELLGMPADENSVDKYFLDGSQSPETMKQFISTMTGVDPARVSVVSNLSGNSKGSEAAKIAKQNPSASFIVYDNDPDGLAMTRNGLKDGGAKDVKEVSV